MKKLLFSLLILIIFNNICAQETHYGDTVQISYIESLSDSLRRKLSNKEYEESFDIVKELNKQDSISYMTLLDCTDSYIYLEKYTDCLAFCNIWEEKLPGTKSIDLFSSVRGEIYFYLKDYRNAVENLSRYRFFLESIGDSFNYYYNAIYAESLHEINRFDDAEKAYENFIAQYLVQEGLELNDVYHVQDKEYVGRILYYYALNSFFLGYEEKGMKLLDLSSKCGYEKAIKDYGHLKNCNAVLMNFKLTNKIKRQFNDYIEKFDFKYNPNGSVNIADDFWNQLVNRDATSIELQTELHKTKRKIMLQKALDELETNKLDFLNYLKDCNPYEVTDLEQGLKKSLAGYNSFDLRELRIYPALDPNAFATPYGQIYLTSGLVLKYNFNNHLLLGVSAHEMTHFICQHSLLRIWKQYEKERKNKILGGIVAGVYSATMTATAMYGASNGVEFNKSYYDNIVNSVANVCSAFASDALYFQFKYSREQEIQADLIAYRFCEAIGLGGCVYITALQLLDENDLYMKTDNTSDHPNMAYRIAFLRYVHEIDNGGSQNVQVPKNKDNYGDDLYNWN